MNDHRHRRPTAGTRPAPARAVAMGALAVAALMLGACGLPQDKEPQKIALPGRQEQALKELVTTTTQGPTKMIPQLLYLVAVGGETDTPDVLEPASVAVRESGPQDLPKAVLEQLLKGPTAEQRARDLRSFVPEGAAVESVRVNNGVATVNFNNLGAIEGRGQRLAAAQIVFTLTELPGITGVRFEVNGKETSVPLGGTESSEPGAPVRRTDYPALNDSLPTSTTTTAPTTAPAAAPAAATAGPG